MNIFVLSRNVRTCARFHCDQHVVKMPVESAQLLSTALHAIDAAAWAGLRSEGLAYLPTHRNHPCAVWTRDCVNNYLWLGALGLALCAEYTFRFGMEDAKTHKTQAVIRALLDSVPALPRFKCISPFPIVVPEEYVVVGDPVGSYRNYYRLDKARFARWTKRDPPDWLTPSL